MAKASLKLTELSTATMGTDLEEHAGDIIIGMLANLFDEKGQITEEDVIERSEELIKNLLEYKRGFYKEAA